MPKRRPVLAGTLCVISLLTFYVISMTPSTMWRKRYAHEIFRQQDEVTDSSRHVTERDHVAVAAPKEPQTIIFRSPPRAKSAKSDHSGVVKRIKRKFLRPRPRTRAELKPMILTWKVDESQMYPDEVRHIVFVKVHKAASTTVYNIMTRFALARDLNIMLPLRTSILSQSSPGLGKLSIHPPSPPFRFDILCNHVVFNFTKIRPYFPSDTKYVAIVRQPWQQVQSAFHYYSSSYHIPYLRKIETFDEYIRNQSKFEPKDPLHSYTLNRMSIDLGLRPSLVRNPVHVKPFLSQLDSVFHMVLIAERFDESMVLMKRLFHWTTKDILYRRLNVLNGSHVATVNPSREIPYIFKQLEAYDIAVYQHYAEIFDQKVAQEGQDFQEEVKSFRFIQRVVSTFCDNKTLPVPVLKIPASNWNKEFVLLRGECDTLSVDEPRMHASIVAKQRKRMLSLLRENSN